jgi:hypothetical protein
MTMRRTMDLAGRRFGRLVVVEPSPTPKGKPKRWLCRCDCGQTATVVGHHLRNGDTKSCGCYCKEKMSRVRLIDLAGQSFGRLTVIRRAKTTHKRTSWLCRCECGSKTTVPGGHLKNGHTRSCGCLRIIDLTGQRFGRLTVISRVGTKHRNALWLCRCECGDTSTVTGVNLTTGNTKSCGCYHSDLVRELHTSGTLPEVDWQEIASRVENLNK